MFLVGGLYVFEIVQFSKGLNIIITIQFLTGQLTCIYSPNIVLQAFQCLVLQPVLIHRHMLMFKERFGLLSC